LDKLRRREIPASMLICLTLADPSGVSVDQVLKGLSVIDTSGSLVKAASITALALRGEKAIERQLDVAGVGEAPVSETVNAIGKLLIRDVHVGLTDVEWFGRLVALAQVLLKPEEAEDFIQAEAEKRSPRGDEAPNTKLGLRVIDAGGTSNA
jgi:hypothetical protein